MTTLAHRERSAASGSHNPQEDTGHANVRRLHHEDYTVGWISALPIEMATAEAMLDEIHAPLPQIPGDVNAYTLGNIGPHNIVLACLPKGGYGTNNAATVATNMLRSFSSIDKRLMVGIGGGAPGAVDVRLGDVVVSDQVIQYDLGKAMPNDTFHRTSVPTRPPQILMTAVSKLQARHARYPTSIPSFVDEMVVHNRTMLNSAHPQSPDLLFHYTASHVSSNHCEDCDHSQLIARIERVDHHPAIHYGKVASGNQVIRDGVTRRNMTDELEVICFEMEAAGLMESFPCLVIRGICDYSDAHKNKHWQGYAAAVAAAYAKELLLVIPETTTPTKTMLPTATQENPQYKTLLENRERLLSSLAFAEIDSRQTSIKPALKKTCEWFLEDPFYLDWLDLGKFPEHLGFLWISGKPGAGKSTLMKFTHGHTQQKWEPASDTAVVAFFFNARGADLEKSTLGMYRSLLYQILQQFSNFSDLQPLLDRYGRPGQLDVKSILWTADNLKQLFQKVIEKLSQRRLICFIDALDECDEDEVREMVSFFEDLSDLAAENGTGLYTCFSSRHYPNIELQRGGLRITLEHQPGHSRDVVKYVQSKLFSKNKKAIEEVTRIILEKAAGVFMWVVLVVDILNKEFQRGRVATIKKHLQELPSKLSDLFKDILRRDSSNTDDLLLCIQWILYSQYPLSCPEMYFALQSGLNPGPDILQEWDPEYITIDDMRLFILSTSRGLAEITSNDVVQFIHESVRDFLLKDNGIHDLWPECSQDFESTSHDRLKDCCQIWAHIEMPDLTSIYKDLLDEGLLLAKPFPFVEYAISCVFYHAESAILSIPQDRFFNDFDFRAWRAITVLSDRINSVRYLEVESESSLGTAG